MQKHTKWCVFALWRAFMHQIVRFCSSKSINSSNLSVNALERAYYARFGVFLLKFLLSTLSRERLRIKKRARALNHSRSFYFYN